MWLGDIETTADIVIPSEPLERVIGQQAAVEKARLAVKQKRHLLLVGPPGVGKSMLAQALAAHLPKATQQISVVHNTQNIRLANTVTNAPGDWMALISAGTNWYGLKD